MANLILNLEKAISEHERLFNTYGAPGLVLLETHGYIANAEIFLDGECLEKLNKECLAMINKKEFPKQWEMANESFITTFRGMKVNKLEQGWELKPPSGVIFS